jgi:hypothetical protein
LPRAQPIDGQAALNWQANTDSHIYYNKRQRMRHARLCYWPELHTRTSTKAGFRTR